MTWIRMFILALALAATGGVASAQDDFPPAGLPPSIKAKLERSVAEAVKAAGISARLLGLGAAPVGSTSDDFAALIRAEYDKWGPVIKAAGIRGE